MTVQEEAKAYRKFRNEEALEYCRKQSMLEQMVGNETWKHYDTASKALEEVEQYRALGTVEELKEAREKQVAKFVECKEWRGYRDTRYKCPSCGKNVRNDETFCHKCGQAIKFPQIKVVDNKVKLDWSEEDE